ncbi:MAG: helix-turn-helix domain-containing protein [Thermoplasmata archaeon]
MEMNELITLIKKLMKNMGLNESSCLVYAVLSVSEKPLCIKEISAKTGYSITMVYSSIKDLMENNLVERIRMGKRILYTANINFIDVFERRRKKLMDEFILPISNIDINKYSKNQRIKEIKEYAKNVYDYFKEYYTK